MLVYTCYSQCTVGISQGRTDAYLKKMFCDYIASAFIQKIEPHFLLKYDTYMFLNKKSYDQRILSLFHYVKDCKLS